MIKVYDGGCIYIGEMESNERVGKGICYFLDDFFAGYKVEGYWKCDKLNGWGKVVTTTYLEEGNFEEGLKNGKFLRYYNDGRLSSVDYRNGVRISEKSYLVRCKKTEHNFGYVKISDNSIYLGDSCNGQPFGFGMIYNIDDKKTIVDKNFYEIYGERFVQKIDINNVSQDVLDK